MALLEVRDGLTGRSLGDWVVPGLDERVAWRVSQGAGLLAEERRVVLIEPSSTQHLADSK